MTDTFRNAHVMIFLEKNDVVRLCEFSCVENLCALCNVCKRACLVFSATFEKQSE